ncbi:MAG: hypothetical protein HC880_01120 [Bacteroidia bacterium]|nr:hypothetical protein [Bacteroidia bacterium]
MLLLITEFNTVISEAVIVFLVELIYVYMYKLIRDIDDPFEYREGEQQGNAEVTLFPLREYIERLRERMKPYSGEVANWHESPSNPKGYL